MKTYKEVIEKPQLAIYHDDYDVSPREWDNVGYFITIEKNRYSPDHDTAETDAISTIIDTTQHNAEDVEEHMQMIVDDIEETLDDEVLFITPIYKYEHGNVFYKRGTSHGFDVSNCGFYIVTGKTAKGYREMKKKEYEETIDAELNTYNQWVNGEVYRYTLHDKNGEFVDSIGGYYSIDEIKNDLPEEWQDEDLEDYLQD